MCVCNIWFTIEALIVIILFFTITPTPTPVCLRDFSTTFESKFSLMTDFLCKRDFCDVISGSDLSTIYWIWAEWISEGIHDTRPKYVMLISGSEEGCSLDARGIEMLELIMTGQFAKMIDTFWLIEYVAKKLSYLKVNQSRRFQDFDFSLQREKELYYTEISIIYML